MSLSSKLRKENDESFASKQRQSTQGLAPEQGLAQLNDIQRDNDLPSRQMQVNDTNFADNYEDIERLAADTDKNDGPSNEEIEESKRASWGQPPLPANAEDASMDGSNSMNAYQQSDTMSESDKAADANWNQSTSEGAIPATRANEPDRTLGNS